MAPKGHFENNGPPAECQMTGRTMKKSSMDIKVISLMVFLYPVFILVQYLLLSEGNVPFDLFGWGLSFIPFAVLGYGVYKLNRKMRFATMMILISMIAGPLIGLVIAPFVDFNLFRKVLEMHGSYVVIWRPLAIFARTFVPNIFYLAFVIYKLARPEIKEQFLK